MGKHTLYVDVDGDDVVIPLPQSVLNSLQWKSGDTLLVKVLANGTPSIRKKTMKGVIGHYFGRLARFLNSNK